MASLSFLVILLACPLTIRLSVCLSISVTIWLFFLSHIGAACAWLRVSCSTHLGSSSGSGPTWDWRFRQQWGLLGIGQDMSECYIRAVTPPPLPCCRTWKLTAEVLLQCMEMGAKW